MKINGNQVRKGNLLLIDDGLWRVTKTQAAKTGKSGAYNQVEMKNIKTGTKKSERFRASESVEKVGLRERNFTYLYQEDTNVVFMDSTDYEQVGIPLDVIGDDIDFLEDGLEVVVEFFDETPVSVNLPPQLAVEIQETEPVVKGQTASSSYKPAVLTNGVRVSVPQFVNGGDKIIIDTVERTYLRRDEA